ncbi:hypothetical protein [Legionella erythra]|uniref:Serine/threonine-protein kinase n=1 Tax=Legionella erythra TaxID=448 RepID=A0A0W0TVR7_LEGER|nr:hypothetical protein [Legionella erythra]KTC99825.1 serine/threonine-protein kinase [Legionella erythra]
MLFKSKTEAYTVAIMELMRLKNGIADNKKLTDRIDRAIAQIKSAIANHEQNPQQVIAILEKFADVPNIAALIIDIKAATFQQSPQEKFENPLGRRLESEVPVLLLKSPTPAIRNAVGRVSAELIKLIKEREKELDDLDVLRQGNNIAIALGAFPNNEELTPEKIIKILADNKPEDFLRIMFIHFKYAQCITRGVSITTAPARVPVGKLRNIVSDLYEKPLDQESRSAEDARLIKFFTEGIRGTWEGRRYRGYIADDLFYGSPLYTAKGNRGRSGPINTRTHNQLGLMLNGQEEHASGFPTEQGSWIPDCKEQRPDLHSPYVLDLIENDAIYVAGPSGMTSLLLGQMEFLANLNDVDLKKNYLAAVVAYIVGGGFHSLHEVIGPAQYALELVPGYQVCPPEPHKISKAPNFQQFFDQQASIDPDFNALHDQAWEQYLRYFNTTYAPKHLPDYKPVQWPKQGVKDQSDNGKMEVTADKTVLQEIKATSHQVKPKPEEIKPTLEEIEPDEKTPLLSGQNKSNPVSSELIASTQGLLKNYIDSRANKKKEGYELNFISRNFRDQALTNEKVKIATTLLNDLNHVTSYPDLQEKISKAFNENQMAEKRRGKTYGCFTKSGLGRCLHNIEGLIDEAQYIQRNSMSNS